MNLSSTKLSFIKLTSFPVLKLLMLLTLFSTGWSANAVAQTIQIGALVAGQVTEVKVKVGQQVKQGQLLMKIDDRRFQAKLRSLQAVQEMARLKLADQKINLDQALDLYDRTVTATRERDAAQLAYNLANQTYLKAKADLAYYQAWAKYFTIKAPVTARVKKINAPTGTTVYKENTPLIELER